MLRSEASATPKTGPAPSRYELKYFVSDRALAEFRRRIEHFVRPDAYARWRPGLCYDVTSLYLDTPDLALYRATLSGRKSRYKLRLRSYRDHDGSVVWAEMKKRIDDVIVKTRVAIPHEDAEALLTRGWKDRNQTLRPRAPHIAEFLQSTSVLDARPAVVVRYRREAYEYPGWPSLRITFDLALRYQVAAGSRRLHPGGPWHAIPTEASIVEIKFTDLFPSWLSVMVAELGMRRQSIPKYGLAVADALARRGYPQTAAHPEALASLCAPLLC